MLVEGRYDRDPSLLCGRTDTFNKVCFPGAAAPALAGGAGGGAWREPVPGDYVSVRVASAEGGRLVGADPALTTLSGFVDAFGSCNPGAVVHADKRQYAA